MPARQSVLPELLRKSARLDDAKPQWPKALFAEPRDESDVSAYREEQIRKRLEVFDEFFKLKSEKPNIWEQRTKALVMFKFGMDSNDSGWWKRFFWYLAPKYIIGFRVKDIELSKIGNTRKWTDILLARLFADIEFLKRKYDWRVNKVCEKLLTKTGYAQRWRGFSSDALRRAYSEARRRRNDLKFERLLCGDEAIFLPGRKDRIEAAINKHGLLR
jgi:hypothetical protein